MGVLFKKKNRINSLDINNTPTTSLTDIKQHVSSYYKDILGTSGSKYAFLDPLFWDEPDKVTPQENHLLEAPFTIEEIKTALFECEANGTPGPDGFSFKFYQGPSST